VVKLKVHGVFAGMIISLFRNLHAWLPVITVDLTNATLVPR
jgi:hypothetical protein